MFRMCTTKKGKTGKSPPLLFPKHLMRLVKNYSHISMSFLRGQNIPCNQADPIFHNGKNEPLNMKNIYQMKGYKVQFFL